MNDESSSGGRGPTSIKPPTIKPPTMHDEQFGVTSLGGAPEAASYRSAPTAQASPPMPSAQLAPPAPRKQNVLLWVVIAALFVGLLVLMLAVVGYMMLR